MAWTCAEVLVIGLVLRDQYHVIREREPLDGQTSVAVYADDVRTCHVRRRVQCSCESCQRRRNESFAMKPGRKRTCLVEHCSLFAP
jgi:hypothetical protein